MRCIIGRKFSITALFVLTASIAAIVSLKTSYDREQQNLIRLSDDSHSEQYLEMGRWISLPPSVVAYTEWKGPVFVESLMRKCQIPWFDRIIRVDIHDSSVIDSQCEIELKKFYYLRTVVLHGNSRDFLEELRRSLDEGVAILDSTLAPGYQLK